jgi:hypothetical protein
MTAPQVQHINLGNYANDGTGDDLRTAFTKVNNNFNVLFGEAAISNADNLGDGTAIFADKNDSTLNLEFKTLKANADGSIVITHDANTVTFQSITKLASDTNPLLGGNLDLSGHNIVGGGDVRTSIWGIDIRILNATVEFLIQTGNTNIDAGTIANPTGSESGSPSYTLDMGPFVNPLGGSVASNVLDFGNF